MQVGLLQYKYIDPRREDAQNTNLHSTTESAKLGKSNVSVDVIFHRASQVYFSDSLLVLLDEIKREGFLFVTLHTRPVAAREVMHWQDMKK